MTSVAKQVEGFDEAYDRLILGRSFVEYQDYYRWSRQRYRRTFERIAGLGLPRGAAHLDIGGGQMALFTSRLLGFEGFSGDVVDSAGHELAEHGINLRRVDLFSGEWEGQGPYDLITLCEVIEHIPRPPYLVLHDLLPLLKPGGIILMTTPNGHRFRNILYMLANRQILGIYRYPDGHEALGHQHEYTLWQMDWQLRAAGLEPLFLEHYSTGWQGASLKARLGHMLTAPAALVPHLRDGLIMAARAPGAAPAGGSAVQPDTGV